ncbi:MAG: DNA cytosine methyltransferase [Methylocystis sp.]|nr:DNA cytosine methyltransferase [Methylocystis sp.]MCA3585958.1 DNA cytosine methyltransferase [Methylocystis sp.]MCA3586412.1 DNA cytosine methyltransferase [Methylocystis sp.]MCA3592899.1 DNA cytosine methyltransferase [Methylocystis sp.]
MLSLNSLELCAGAGGQAIGLERAGFGHVGLFENDFSACNTLRLNRPHWPVFEHDLFQDFDFKRFQGVDLLAGGLPCPPFSKAGKQLGQKDERNLFTRGIEIADQVRPRAIMFENVRGMLDPAFAEYRDWISGTLGKMGYQTLWKLLHSSDFGVPQLRPRVVLVALKSGDCASFEWPAPIGVPRTVGETLFDLMSVKGWLGANAWRDQANTIAPTIVGGSKKHGGPDLGPTRARNAWAALGVNGKTVAAEAPDADSSDMPRLTVRMVARLQGFPDEWGIWGAKTAAYRQVGNAFPPPVAAAVGQSIAQALMRQSSFSAMAAE